MYGYWHWDSERSLCHPHCFFPLVTHNRDHACMPSKMAFPPSTPRSFQLRSKWVTVPSARLVKKTAGWKTVGKNCTELSTSLSWWKHQMHRNKMKCESVKYSESGMWNTFTASPLSFQNLKIARFLQRLHSSAQGLLWRSMSPMQGPQSAPILLFLGLPHDTIKSSHPPYIECCNCAVVTKHCNSKTP